MNINRYLRAYNRQKANAGQRGVEFLLTFKEWCDFWGEDIDRRGNGSDDLQMQRFGDSGPYAVGNIKKGTPKQNAATMGLVRRTRNSALSAKARESELDRLMAEESGEDKWLDDDAHELSKLGYAGMSGRRHYFAADKH